MQYRTKGIIIKRRNLGEADRLLTIYTEKKGKVEAVAKGCRRSLSKLAGHLELFYLSDLILFEGKSIDTITNVQLIEDFSDLRKRISRILYACCLAELTDQLIKEKEPSKKLFSLLLKGLQYLNQKENPLLLTYFGLHLLSLLGHRPELEICVKCRRKLKPDLNYFSNRLGGVLCSNCYKYDFSSKKISLKAIKLFRLLLNNDISVIDKLKIDNEKEGKEIEGILYQFIQEITERELKTRKFFIKGDERWIEKGRKRNVLKNF